MLEIRRKTERTARKIAPLISTKVDNEAGGQVTSRDDNLIRLGQLLEKRLEPKMAQAEMALCLVEAILELEFGKKRIRTAAWQRMAGTITGAILRNKTLKKEADLYIGRILLRR